MYSAIIVEPADPLPELEPAREFVLVSSEWYPGKKPVDGLYEGDLARMEAADPEYVVFNGVANQYVDRPLQARPNELIRLWVMNAGPTLTNAFHVIGALFDHVYPDGNPTNQLNGVQTWNVPPGGGTMFELRIPDEGSYPFVTHSFAYTGLGAVGLIEITNDAPELPSSYPAMASPFDGGLTEASGEVGGSTPTTDATPSADQADAADGEGPTISAKNVAFDTADLAVQPGDTVTFRNEDSILHDVTVDELGIQATADASETVTFTIPDDASGSYTFYCSIPGHREAGMEGTLTVG
jgi:plastocyanin